MAIWKLDQGLAKDLAKAAKRASPLSGEDVAMNNKDNCLEVTGKCRKGSVKIMSCELFVPTMQVFPKVHQRLGHPAKWLRKKCEAGHAQELIWHKNKEYTNCFTELFQTETWVDVTAQFPLGLERAKIHKFNGIIKFIVVN